MHNNMPVLLTGYFQENLGDDLFFKIVSERYCDISFFSYSCIGFYSKTYRNENVSVPNYLRLLNPIFSSVLHLCSNRKLYGFFYRIISQLERHLKKTDLSKFCAELSLIGSCFMRTDSDKQNIDLHNACVPDSSFHLQDHSVKRFICGANIGPVSEIVYLNDIKHEIESYDDVCFRDMTSYRLYSFMPNVRYAPDIIFNLDITQFQHLESEKRVFVSLVDLSNKINSYYPEKHNYNKLTDILLRYAEKGYFISLVSFCKLERDEYILKQLKRRSHHKNFELISYNGKNLDLILRKLAVSEYVISGRFHAMILSILFHKPFFPICYDDKMVHYLKDIKFKGDFAKPDDLNFLTFDRINDNFKYWNYIDTDSLISNAAKQFDAFDDFILNR